MPKKRKRGNLQTKIGSIPGVSLQDRPARVYPAGSVAAQVVGYVSHPTGDELKGPALFESATTTVLVREGEQVRVTPHGWLDIRLG